jgi:hypothetical protein
MKPGDRAKQEADPALGIEIDRHLPVELIKGERILPAIGSYIEELALLKPILSRSVDSAVFRHQQRDLRRGGLFHSNDRLCASNNQATHYGESVGPDEGTAPEMFVPKTKLES